MYITVNEFQVMSGLKPYFTRSASEMKLAIHALRPQLASLLPLFGIFRRA